MHDLNGGMPEHRLKPESISAERLDGEVIAIDFTSGKYFSFLGPAAEVMWLLQNEISREHWFPVVSQVFKSPPSEEDFNVEMEDFLGQLLALGVIEPSSGLTGARTLPPDDCVRGDWSAPLFTLNDDLAELLVIDPIHETGDDGWPATKPS